ncbi:hypothetical protein O3P69_009204 [Scylla paramamosain]|uniref:DUF4789 domain-containing protein n=1 Tax=Scylla paramamosain TaxID=85552 RepID=A0AAW0T9F2_SCYPA
MAGNHQQIDPCARDEVLVRGTCHRLLTRGPCAPDEYVLLDPADHKGFCAARLCAPDRIFVFSDQLCHDPLNSMMCPPGRQLYQTAYGTPLCQCPDGTYEADDDLDDDVCQPLLGTSISCPSGQVLWFRDFTRPPECLPDPCGGKNLRRGPNDLPFVPSAEDGKCYQLGQTHGVCPAQTWYSLALQTLRGVCVSVEDAGYEVFDEATMSYLTQLYGPLISREIAAPSPSPSPAPAPAPTSALSPAPGPTFTPTLTQQTPLPPQSHLEQQHLFAGSQGSSGGREARHEPGRATTSQADTQDSLFSGQQMPKKVTDLDTYGQGYTEHARPRQEEPGRAVQHHIEQQAHGQEGSLPSRKKGIARGQENLANLASPTMTPDDNGTSLRESPQQAVIQSANEPPSEHFHAHSPHITSKPSHSFSSPTYYSLPQKTVSQPSSAFPSHSQQQPDHYMFPHQHHEPLPAQSSSSSLPFPSVPAFSSHYSDPEHHASPSQAPPTHSSVIPNLPKDTRPSNYYSQPSSTSHHLPQASPALSPRLALHQPPRHATSHSTLLIPASFERQQLSLETFGAPNGKVVMNQQFAPQGSPTSRAPSSHASAVDASGHQNSFNGSTTWEPKERQHHSLPHQQQQQQHQQHHHHRGRRSTLPHASPGNVIQPLLTACRAGAQRDVNAKCREIVLPAKLEGARDVKAAPPVPPRPSCPEGQAYNSKRKCVSVNEAINSVNAFNLGK